MSRLDEGLAHVLEPVRDLAVGELLDLISGSLEQGLEIRNEPILRDDADRVLREGPLHLPARADLVIRDKGRNRMEQAPSAGTLSFDPVTVNRSDGFSAVIAPFRWSAAQILVEGSGTMLNWTPIRRWYLEAFQTRFTDLSPDLDGTVHALSGPSDTDAGWAFEIDFGSAPAETIAEMLDAFALAGAARVVMGSLKSANGRVR